MTETERRMFTDIAECIDDYGLRVLLMKDAAILEDIDPECCHECDDQYDYMLDRIAALVTRIRELRCE